MENPNNIKIGDVIEVQQAWEDETGNYHDEFATVLEIKDDGDMRLKFHNVTKEIQEFLDQMDHFAKDYSPEPNQ